MHWNLRYLRYRAYALIHEWLHPHDPWLTPDAVRFLGRRLSKNDAGFEWGSGRSTLWFSSRVKSLISVEESSGWYERVRKSIGKAGTLNVQLLYRPPQEGGEKSGYVTAIDSQPRESLDFILVDGALRAYCCQAAVDKLKSGGLLILDDAQRYIPFREGVPQQASPDERPHAETWKSFFAKVREWSCLWTTNGISATAIWSKPSPVVKGY